MKPSDFETGSGYDDGTGRGDRLPLLLACHTTIANLVAGLKGVDDLEDAVLVVIDLSARCSFFPWPRLTCSPLWYDSKSLRTCFMSMVCP